MTIQHVENAAQEQARAALEKRFYELREEVQQIIEDAPAKATDAVLETFVEAKNIDTRLLYSICDISAVVKQWSLTDQKRYAEALGYSLEFKWEDEEFHKFFKKASNLSTTVGKIGYDTYALGMTGMTGARIKAWNKLSKEKQWSGIEDQWRRDFPKRYINELIERFEQAKKNESIIVRESFYSSSEGKQTPPLKVANTPKNRAELKKLKSFIEEYQLRQDLVSIRLLGDTSYSTTHLRED